MYVYDIPASSTVELEDTTRPVKTEGSQTADEVNKDAPNKHRNAQSPRFFQLYMGHDDDIVRRLCYFGPNEA